MSVGIKSKTGFIFAILRYIFIFKIPKTKSQLIDKLIVHSLPHLGLFCLVQAIMPYNVSISRDFSVLKLNGDGHFGGSADWPGCI